MEQENFLVTLCDSLKDRYRFGFNGQENVNEIVGLGNHTTAEFWEYDTRLGRRWNIDPVFKGHESPYAAFGNSPIWLIDPNGADTLVNEYIIGESEIMKRSGDPKKVQELAGIKLQSYLSINFKITDGKIANLNYKVTPVEFESPVLGGMKPAYTKVLNEKTTMSWDKKNATISYDVVTELSSLEALGQWFMNAGNGIFQDNIIEVTQSVHIEIDMDKITTSVDGSSFPEHRFVSFYFIHKDGENKKNRGLKIDSKEATLEQSSYKDAVNSDKFTEKLHKDKTSFSVEY